MKRFFLGLDCSTKRLTGTIINYDTKEIICEEVVKYDDDLSVYGTHNGVILDDNPTIVHSNPLMWADALELLFEQLEQSYELLDKIKVISGSAQQHGTVYLNAEFEENLRELNHHNSIREQIRGSLTRKSSPVWMDSSTSKQCKEIREALGGREEVIKITGSNTFERFSGPQIRKFYQLYPQAYKNTAKIHLVSSFLSSILSGQNAPIDYGDGSGMNLMNIKRKEWDQRALNATAPELRSRLPPLVNSDNKIGTISPYFAEKYSLSPDTITTVWSGDNPNSLIGLGLTEPGNFAISLGTSDTFFSVLKEPYLKFQEQAHIFRSPSGDYMGLICYKNGSLAREVIKNNYNLSWKEFSEILRQTPAGNRGKIMLPYFSIEIVPLVSNPKVYRFGFEKDDCDGNVRGIIEAQFLSMRLHSHWIREEPTIIHATGGAAANREILQVAADIFQTPIAKFKTTNSAALGAALRAAKRYYEMKDKNTRWENFGKSFIENQKKEVIHPNRKNEDLYKRMVEIYKNFENYIVKGKENPEKYRQAFIKTYFQKP